MARPKSEDKRSAITAAAVRVIARHGLGAPTALIAREAGVANGSLFTYFDTKAALFNELYLELKTDMAAAAMEGVPLAKDLRAQSFCAWSNWTRWAVGNPSKRKVLTQLASCDEITPATRAAGHQIMSRLANLLDRVRAEGPMRDSPTALVGTLMNALAEATMDFMTQDPAKADQHAQTGFEALWRMVG